MDEVFEKGQSGNLLIMDGFIVADYLSNNSDSNRRCRNARSKNAKVSFVSNIMFISGIDSNYPILFYLKLLI